MTLSITYLLFLKTPSYFMRDSYLGYFRKIRNNNVKNIHGAETPMVSARVTDLGFGQFELKKPLAETETLAETEIPAKTPETGRNRSKPAETVRNRPKVRNSK